MSNSDNNNISKYKPKFANQMWYNYQNGFAAFAGLNQMRSIPVEGQSFNAAINVIKDFSQARADLLEAVEALRDTIKHGGLIFGEPESAVRVLAKHDALRPPQKDGDLK